jgi:NTE family protein
MDVSDYVKSIFSALEEMHDFIMHNINVKQDKKVKDRLENLEKKYSDIFSRRGRIINELIHIKRNEDEKSHHSLFEDWDYSIETIRELIRQGEKDADSALEDRKSF